MSGRPKKSPGDRYRPLSTALRLMKQSVPAIQQLGDALHAGIIPLIGRHSTGVKTGRPVLISVPELQGYTLFGTAGFDDIPGLPIYLRDGAPLPEFLAPPMTFTWRPPHQPKNWAYTDFWTDLHYDHWAFERWQRGEFEADAAAQTLSLSARANSSRGRKPGDGSYDEVDQPLLDEMQELIKRGKAVSPEAAARLVAHKAFGKATFESKVDRLAKKYRRYQQSDRNKSD